MEADTRPPGTAEPWSGLGAGQRAAQSTPRPAAAFVRDALTSEPAATQLGRAGPAPATGTPITGLTSAPGDLAPALVAASEPLQPTRPGTPPPLPGSAEGPPPLGASSSLALSDAGWPGTAPPLLVGLSLLATWRALWLLARVRPPAICLSSPTPPG
jgi:hypothetical protein